MTYNILATGSSGNAVIINDNILIDCGVPYKTIKPFTGKIKLVLLTHKHNDHFKPSTVSTLHKQHPAIRFGCCEWMVKTLVDAGVNKRMIDVYEIFMGTGNDYLYPDGTLIKPTPTIHNVQNCAYSITIPRKRLVAESLFYATDVASLDGIIAKDYDFYLIEANHKQAEIERRIEEKRAAGEYAYEYEAMRNHLSEEQALEWLAKNAGPNSQYVFLHQHKEKGVKCSTE